MGSLLRSDLIKWANEQIGTMENPIGSNRTRYGELLDSVGFFNTNKNGVAWCSTFCEAGVFESCYDDTNPDYDDNDRKWDALAFTYEPQNTSVNYGCACRYSAQYFRDHGAWHTKDDFEEGDFVFFGDEGNEYHQGIVTERMENRQGFYSVEGNHDNGVFKVWHDIDENISGFGVPMFDDEPEPTPEPTTDYVSVDLPVLYKGIDDHGTVLTIQALLREFGFTDNDGNVIAIDGIFGDKTEEAVRSYQEARGLDVCGIVNYETWNRILK
jgi:hypothetical protein